MQLVPNDANLNELSHDDSFYRIVLYLFWSEAKNKAHKVWCKFVDDLIHKNRFSSDSDIVIELYNKAELATYEIPQGTILYRARIYNGDLLSDFAKGFVKSKKSVKSNDSMSLDLDPVQVLPLAMVADPERGFDHIQNAYRKWRRKKFKGYNKKQSSAPPKEHASTGRANPEYISYLYLCEDTETPIYEVHPTIGQDISIARLKTNRPLKLYDLTLSLPDHFEAPIYDAPSLYDIIGKYFSTPNTGNAIQYLPTQYLSEVIKKMGFDGLRFNSSLHQGGKNIVLFDPNSCDVISSDIVKVENIEIKTCRPDIYYLDNMSSSMLDI